MQFMYVALVVLCSFSTSRSENFRLVGPSVSLIAVVGEDFILPCSLQPKISAVDMRVEWFRLDQAALTVHLYTDHEDKSIEQAESYRGRTALFKEELQEGNTSLKLSVVQLSDEGAYKCLVKSENWYDDITLNIIVEVTGRDPVITLEELYVSGALSLVCESKGWNPEPEVEWLDSEGVTLNAKATQTHRDSEGFSVKRCITIYKSDSNRFYCRVKQRYHVKQTEVIISNKSFMMWRISIIFNFLFSSIVLIAGLITCAYCRRKEYFFARMGRFRIHEKRRVDKEIEKNILCRVDVVMDIGTAHPYLNLVDDGKEVKYGEKRKDFSDAPNAFDDCVFILGKEGFKKSFYFEVQVRGKTEWTLGVAKETIRRKGEIALKPEFGFWTLSMGNSMFCPSASVSPRHKLKKVGVFVDYNEGVVSFYDVIGKAELYSFTDQHFSEKLYPIFSPGFKHGGQNTAPLIITPISESRLKTHI
ncbi:butyrophilin subfamily 1 member A1-like [Colossoma macropomum]|uniref:butyrophilin subfamily 1 member A1-like n=1 Tax=Colossoma macropomum TaxID=42526 RepID=UPI001863B014|nr:butyrophilin subfamily 1 member A1-like [Colossoma macropomum]